MSPSGFYGWHVVGYAGFALWSRAQAGGATSEIRMVTGSGIESRYLDARVTHLTTAGGKVWAASNTSLYSFTGRVRETLVANPAWTPGSPDPTSIPALRWSGEWDPFFAACQDTQTTINMHIGSSSRMPATSPDAPTGVAATLSFNNAMASMSDWLFSGKLVQFPELTLAYSEGQIGWIPYILERADTVWQEHRAWANTQDLVPEPPSTYYYRQIYGCFFRDRHGIEAIDIVGPDNVTFETDYPHTDSTWPDTKKVAEELMAGVPQDVVDKVMRTNAARMLHIDLSTLG